MAVVSARPQRHPLWTAKTITQALATDYASPLNFRQQFVVMPNVNSLLPWEADLLAATHSGYLTEVEIKVSAGDWRADVEKDKWRYYGQPTFAKGWEKVKFFWYAAPLQLAQRFEDFKLPDWAGVYGMVSGSMQRIQVLRPAKARQGHRKLTHGELKQLARLGSMKLWARSNGLFESKENS